MDLLRSLPIGLYLEQPITWLHKIDARVKLLGLLTLLLTPIAANVQWRLTLMLLLFLLTFLSRLPFRVWWQQMRLLLFFALLLFTVTLFAPDGVTAISQPRLPANDQPSLSSNSSAAPKPSNPAAQSPTLTLPAPTTYSYTLFKLGPLKATRRSLEIAIRTGSLVFSLLYSTSLYLLTTAPEEITEGLEELMQPLRRFGVPVTEIILMLTLSLRFIPLVLEEVQNLMRSVWTRAIDWKKLGVKGSAQVWSAIAERLFDNLLVRAEQIASAMQVRGFTSPNRHRVKWHLLKLRPRDGWALVAIALLCGARFIWGN
jgi:energy-coupling factor transport system permease protein